MNVLAILLPERDGHRYPVTEFAAEFWQSCQQHVPNERVSKALMHLEHQIADFLSGKSFAVVGASTDRSKYGNKVLRCFHQHDYSVVPFNPREKMIEGLAVAKSLTDCRPVPHAISIITPPDVTEKIVKQAVELGIKHIWMQPGAGNAAAVATCQQAGCSVISGGPCILVVLGYRET